MADFDNNRFAAKSIEYETPENVFAPLNEEFHFTLDVCATSQNKKCTRFFTKEEDGLSQIWQGVCWCNPPYGRELPNWIKKSYQASKLGVTVVMLIPARTNTSWWHDLVLRGEVRFVRGRPRFNNGKHGLPFPLAVVIFRSA